MIRLVVFLVCALAAGPAQSGQVGFQEIAPYTDWEPTGCSKPDAPYTVYFSSTEEYNYAVGEFNNFLDEARTYISCVADEAGNDLQTLQGVITEGVETAQQDMTREIDDARFQLQNSRP